MKTCDSCGDGVRAEWLAHKGKGVLYFCHHHKKQVAEKLLSTGWGLISRTSLENMEV